jgi:hypothetical protein
VCAQLHFTVCRLIRIKLDNEHWYEHVPKSVETNQDGKATILWSQKVQTDRTDPNNQPDAIIRHNKRGKMCVNRCWQFQEIEH